MSVWKLWILPAAAIALLAMLALAGAAFAQNASCAQYGCTPTPPPRLPYTGLDLATVFVVGAVLAMAGLIIACALGATRRRGS